ncbi:hypothetical protein PtA15_4A181 [Puccinia triticina]|nr:uncharacterized protein PtA15_4A181 [Puccinia triticina]WAQ83733.1 hypothetical protein PtA15_4A181 [Puccinia triticina]WAR54575.1 hypothetical protein PtB15_4B192 [Puccinia triticina]
MALVSLWVSSPDTHSERRWSPRLTIAELRAKLQPITGIPAASQRLALSLHPASTHSIPLDNDQLSLADYGLQDGATIDVVDSDPRAASQAGQYNDVSQVDKFELPKEEYEKRPDSLLAFKMRNKLGRFNDADPAEQPAEPAPPSQSELLGRYPPGSRCQLVSRSSTADALPARGTLRFVGPAEFNQKHPFWIGVELDEPSGKNDGSVDGHRYFTCPPSRGIFVQPDRIQIGDFPPIDFLQDDEI